MKYISTVFETFEIVVHLKNLINFDKIKILTKMGFGPDVSWSDFPTIITIMRLIVENNF